MSDAIPKRAGAKTQATVAVAIASALALVTVATAGDDYFAAYVIEYRPAPGQFINDPQFNDPTRALGPPVGGGPTQPDNSKVVSLGSFGGSITLGFSRTVMDDPRNPHGLDAIVFSNAFYVGGHPNRRWAEPAHIEISRDVSGNGIADDPWYLIPGSHIPHPWAQWQVQWWDNDPATATPPGNIAWYPDPATFPWAGPTYSTAGYVLDHYLFGPLVVENPNGLDATEEGYFGYAGCTPTLTLPDGVAPEDFYTVPDNPFLVGICEGSGGGDAFDIAWAIDPITGAPANLDGFDFIRITSAVAYDPHPVFGEKSTEIAGVAIVRPLKIPGDINGDGVVDQADLALLLSAYGSAPGDPNWNPDADLTGDGLIGHADLGLLLANWGS